MSPTPDGPNARKGLHSAPVQPGAELGPYRVGARIGSGGMGDVYRARDTRLDREVALKVLRPEMTGNPDRRERFVREARAASRLNHPNTVTVYDIGEQDGLVYIAMEYLAGRTLDEVIPANGLAAADCLEYAIPIATAVAKAHAAGIIHRDLKPGNIMVTTDGVVKVLDFGLAKLMQAPIAPDESTRKMQFETKDGIFVGTPAYASPEQAEGNEVDTRSDIFSFGSVLYEMATGKRAFRGDSMMATMAAVLHSDPDPPPASVPADLQKIMLRCLKKDPDSRFQNMADVRVSLEELRQESDARSGSAAPSAWAVSPPPARWRKALLIGAVAAAAVALTLVATQALRRSADNGALRTVKFTITPGQLAKGDFQNIDTGVFISGDGKHIAYIENTSRQLWVRDLDQEQAHPVPGATGVYEAFGLPTISRLDMPQVPAALRSPLATW